MFESSTFHIHYRNANLLGRSIIWGMLQETGDGNFIANVVTLKLVSYTAQTEETRNADKILVY
jgi:hypothetical protein